MPKSSRFRGPLERRHGKRGRNADSYFMRASLSSWVITVKLIEFQRSLLDTWKIFRPFLNTVTSCDKYSLTSTDKWMQIMQMHLSQKQNIFAQFFSAFLKSALNFEHFQKKMPSWLMYYRNYRPRKEGLDKCLKTPVWEDLSNGDMVNGAKHWFNHNQNAFIILSDHSEGNWVAKVTLRYMKILETFS